MNQYQNVAADNGRSKFMKVSATGALTELYFTSKRATVPLGGSLRIPTVSASATLTEQKNVAAAGETPVYLGNSVKLTYNIVAGDASALVALRAELNRVMDAAIEDYNLNNGFVPTPAATFTQV